MFKDLLYLVILLFLSSLAFASGLNKSSIEQIQLNRLKINLGEQIFNQIENDPSYVEMFKKAYGANVTSKNIIDALTEYERSLTTSSRFDDYRRGNKNALTPEEIRGYQLFTSYGCGACHTGENLGGTQFKLLARNYIIERKTLLTPADLGLAEVTKKSKDFYVFKVPSMRNVAITYPYYHDGSVKSLDEAVYLMGKYQLGVEISDQDVKAIVTFLKSFTSKSFEQHNSNAPINHE
jgi:cytochrome c peroxidase